MPDTGHLLHTHVWFQKHWMYPVLTPQAPKSKNPRRFSELTSDLEFKFKLVSKLTYIMNFTSDITSFSNHILP